MAYHLARHCHAAFVGPDLVLLDVQADAYLCLPDLSAVASLGQDGEVRVEDPSAVRSLQTAGLLSGRVEARRSPPPLPTRALEAGGLDPGWGHRLRLLLCCMDLLLAYPGRSFAGVLRPWLKRAPATAMAATPEAARLAEVFRRLVVWAPAPRKCLVRSFLLKRFLERSGCRADWVFGVRTWPFGAHCWIQAGDLALDDQPERLAVYTPILVV